MNLIVDIGNTNSKIALFDEGSLIKKVLTKDISREMLEQFVGKENISSTIFCFVGETPPDINTGKLSQSILLDHSTPLPITNKYSSPLTLGYDRIASVIGAGIQISNREILCIDAGTCITYDFMNARREYLGGGISPGLNLRFKALNIFTEKLPLVQMPEYIEDINFIGDSTHASILSGVFFGVVGEVNGVINLYKEKYPEVAIVLTGGNANLFESYIKSEIFAFPDSVLHGLNAILEYNK